jgi:hypothetical protein
VSVQHLENWCSEEFARCEARKRHVFSVGAHCVQDLGISWVGDPHSLLEPRREVTQPLPEGRIKHIAFDPLPNVKDVVPGCALCGIRVEINLPIWCLAVRAAKRDRVVQYDFEMPICIRVERPPLTPAASLRMS